LTGKKWLERQKPSQNRGKEPPKLPIKENFPQSPKNPKPNIIKNKPIITAGKPSNKDNSLLKTKTEKTSAITNYQPQPLIGEIPLKSSEKFFLNTSEQLPVITNGEQLTDKEQILLARIKQLEEQLAKSQAENNNLKLENKHLKALIKKDHETETKILQPLKLKN
jgi:hypothetical protein